MGTKIMNKRGSRVLYHQGPQDLMETEFMNAPNASLSTPYRADLQTQAYRPLSASDEVVLNPSAAADLSVFWLDDAVQQLQEVYQEVKEALELDNEIVPVPDIAYGNAYWLLEVLFAHNASMPDIGWLMDGGIGFEWRSRDRKGIATISIYGNNQIVYGASLGGTRRTKGTCDLSDLRPFTGFLTMLIILFSE